MEARGLLDSEWGVSPRGKRAKFYRITAAGRSHLKNETERWNAYVAAVARAMTAVLKPA
jgi:DNA-binding PadR family transcriptional regulator